MGEVYYDTLLLDGAQTLLDRGGMSTGSGDIRHLIPLLHPETGVHDLDALKAWYEAVADGLRTVVEFDLFALWIYSPGGEPILIEPEALTQDSLEVPHARPTAPLEALVAIGACHPDATTGGWVPPADD